MDSEMPVLKCDYCNFVTEKRSRYDDHIKMHRNIRDLPCVQCGKLFVTKKTLRQHIIKVHRRAATASSDGAVVATPSAITSRSFVIPTQVEKISEEETQSTDAAVTAAETSTASSTASQELFTARNMTDNFSSSSSTIDHVTVQSSVTMPVEYQMLVPLPSTAAVDGSASLPQVAAVSGAGPIIVGISIDNVAAYPAFQPFDLQNAGLVL